MKPLKREALYLILLVPLVSFAVLLHLDSAPFRQWDESYLATHTRLMLMDHDFIVTHSDSGPEMSNTKPPFAIWCMVLMSALVGYGELAIRLPNAIAGVLICFVTFFFLSRRYQSAFAGFTAVMILISSAAFIRYHVIRTAEYDGLLMLFMYIFSLAYYLLMQDDTAASTRTRLWVLFSLSVILAVLTKGIQSLMVMPALLLYTIMRGKLKWVLSSKAFYLSAVSITVFGLGYYLLREHFNPGYIHAVWENELGGRYVAINEGHKGPFWYYLADIVKMQENWLPIFILGACYTYTVRDPRIKSLLIFSITICLVYLLVISVGATKLYWYEAPILPFFSIIGALGLWAITGTLAADYEKNVFISLILPAVVVLLLSTQGYLSVIRDNQIIPAEGYDDSLVRYLKEAMKSDIPPDTKIIYNSNGLSDNVLRCELFKANAQGLNITWEHQMDILKPGDIVVTSQAPMREAVKGAFHYEVRQKLGDVEMWVLKMRKSGA